MEEMNIKKVIEGSFENKGNRSHEEMVIGDESNQKSVNTYLIQKIHTLEDRVN
jgi:predicted HicB family RNase H-like nuclease